MIFQAYEIAGQAVGIDLQSWLEEDLQGNEPFVFEDVLRAGYRDITTLKNIYNLGLSADVDFKFVRDEMKRFVIALGEQNIISTQLDPSLLTPSLGDAYMIGVLAIGDWLGKDGQIAVWNGLDWDYLEGNPATTPTEEYGFSLIIDAQDRQNCASYLIGTIPQQIQAFGGDLTLKSKAQARYKKEVQECRGFRYKYVENDFLQQIPAFAGAALAAIGITNIYYRDQGIDGEFYGDAGITGMGDWVQSFGAYAGIGLRDQAWITIDGRNMDQYADFIADRLFDTGLTKYQKSLVK